MFEKFGALRRSHSLKPEAVNFALLHEEVKHFFAWCMQESNYAVVHVSIVRFCLAGEVPGMHVCRHIPNVVDSFDVARLSLNSQYS